MRVARRRFPPETRIVVRQACDRDGEAVGGFLAGLSPASRYQRFFGVFHEVSPELIREMTTTTPSRLVRLALHGDAVVGHVMAAVADEGTAEVGIVVADDYRYRGIGGRLVRETLDALRALGCTEVRCDVLGGNEFVLDWLRHLLPDLSFARDAETVTAHGRLPPSAPT